MGLLSDLFKSTEEKWMEGASHDELSDAYEAERQQWIKDGYNNGTGEKTNKMNRISEEISKRVEKNGKMIQDVIRILIFAGQMLIDGIKIESL